MNGLSSHRYAVMAAVGMMLLHGLVNCGSSLPSGGGPGGTGGTGVTSCPNGGMPPLCIPGDLAGTSGGDVGGHGDVGGTGGGGQGGTAGDPFGCICDGTPPVCRGEAGCSGLLGRGGTGGGGAAGTGGSAGGGGSAGSGGSGGGTAWAPPSCLRDLFAACPIDGACHARVTDAGFAGYCLASGAAAESTERHSCGAQVDGGISNDEVSVYKPDGSLCFKFEARWHYSCESASWTWTNGAGETIATGQGDWGQGTHASAQCTTGGEATSCGIGTCEVTTLTGPLGPFGPTSCSAGTCP